GLRQPIFRDIAVAIKGNERLRSRQQTTRQQSQISAGGLSDDTDTIRIGIEKTRSPRTDPGIGVGDVFNDFWKLRFGSQSVIDGDDRIAGVDEPVALRIRELAAAAVDQRSAVNPKNHWARLASATPVNRGLDRMILLCGLINISRF